MNLNLKPFRSQTPKAAIVRRPYRPGLHGRDRHSVSEFGILLREKQKMKAAYGLREAAMRRVFERALRVPGVTGRQILSLLERRLDNAVFRLGLAPSRSVARQLVSHGHILMNGRRTRSPSALVRVGDTIAVRPISLEISPLSSLKESIKKYEPPTWLTLDAEKFAGTVKSEPSGEDASFDVGLVVDYYSK